MTKDADVLSEHQAWWKMFSAALARAGECQLAPRSAPWRSLRVGILNTLDALEPIDWRKATRISKPLTADDRTLHSAISRIQSNDAKRMGCAQYLGDED